MTCWLWGFLVATAIVFAGMAIFRPKSSSGGVGPTAGDIIIQYMVLPLLAIAGLGTVLSLAFQRASKPSMSVSATGV